MTAQATESRPLCALCGAPLHTGSTYCSRACSNKATKGGAVRWSPMRSAVAGRDPVALIAAVEEKCLPRTSPEACLVWDRRVDCDGYPRIFWGGRSFTVHRLVADICGDRPIGSQPVHHICANRLCLNPRHLVPVTQAENNAEMLGRRAYEARIAELEAALVEVAPNHPVLRGA